MRTTLHGVHVRSYLRRLSSHEPVTLVAGDGYDPKRFIDLDEVGAITVGDDGVSPFDAYVAVGAPSLWLLRSIGGRRRFGVRDVVVVDEGLGSYGTVLTRRRAMQREGAGAGWATVRAAAVSASRSMARDRWSLFEVEGGRWVVNDEIAAEFRSLPVQGTHAPAADVIYLSQPWIELGVVSVDVHLGHLEHLRDVCASARLTFAVKPHRWEDRGRYVGFDVIEGDQIAEADGTVRAARLVVGEASTALLTLSSVLGRRAMRVAGPASTQRSVALSRRQRSLLETFVGPPITVDRMHSLLGGAAHDR
jgi:hypothetical protein